MSLTSALYIVPAIFRIKGSDVMCFRKDNKTSVVLIQLVIWMSWIIFMGGEFIFGYGLPMILQSVKSFVEFQFQKLSIPLHPATTYYISSILRQLVTLYVVLTGFMTLVFLRNRGKAKAYILIMGIFLSVFPVIPLFLFWETATILPRILLFSAFPWSILIAIYISSVANKLRRVLILIPLIIFAMLIPVSKYGAEPINYIPSSTLRSATFVVEKSSSEFLILIKPSAVDPPNHIYMFYASLYGKKVQILGYRKEFSISLLEGNISNAIQIMEPTAPVVFTSTYQNALYLRENSLVLRDIEEAISNSFSLIYDSGSARIYRKTFNTATIER
jgi:hypothetical protein